MPFEPSEELAALLRIVAIGVKPGEAISAMADECAVDGVLILFVLRVVACPKPFITGDERGSVPGRGAPLVMLDDVLGWLVGVGAETRNEKEHRKTEKENRGFHGTRATPNKWS